MRKVTFPFLKTMVIVFGVLLLATNVALAQVPVSLPHLVSRAGITRNIDVTVGTLPGALSVLSYQFDLTYDTTVIRITGYTLTGTISARATAPVVLLTPGVVKVAVASDSIISGTGALIRFTADMVAPGTTALTLSGFKFNEGNPSASPITQGQVVIPSFSVSLPASDTFRVIRTATFNIPIRADALTGKGILSYQFTVSYDTSRFTITGVSISGTSSAAMPSVLVNTTVVGQVSVAAASADTTPITGADGATLIYLKARVKAHAQGNSALTFVDFQFNEGDPAVGAIDGSIYVDDVTAIKVIDRVPTQYVLDQNYPNPFNPTTMITFGIPSQTTVTLEVYNILGMKVRTLIAGERMNAAKYSIEWDGKDNSGITVPSGVYLYRLHANGFDAAKKMVLMK